MKKLRYLEYLIGYGFESEKSSKSMFSLKDHFIIQINFFCSFAEYSFQKTPDSQGYPVNFCMSTYYA